MNDYFGMAFGHRAISEDTNFVYGPDGAYPKWAGTWRVEDIRSKAEHPYAYSPHIVQGPRTVFEGKDVSSVYDDRCASWWGHDRWRELCKKHIGDRVYAYAGLDMISALLSEGFDKRIECLQIIEGCNVGNGYPYRIFVYRDLDYVEEPK